MRTTIHLFNHFVLFVISVFGLLILISCANVTQQPTPTSVPPTDIPPTETPVITATPHPGLDEVTGQVIDLTVAGETESHDYLLYLPENYAAQEEWPLIIYLHGAGSRGDDISMVNRESFMNSLGTLVDLPAIVVAPQTPTGQNWNTRIPVLEEFLTAVTQQYPIDSNRIYLTGFSMGGFGSWAWGLENPDLFAAIAPMAGGYFTSNVPHNICDLKDTPIWAFASSADTVVPGAKTTVLTDALEDCGSESVKLTLYDDASHGEAGAWPYYNESGLYDWFWEQSLASE